MDRTATFYSAPSYHHRGGGFPVYAGSRRQRGGGILGSLAKFAMPVLGQIGKAALGQAVGFAKDVAGDVAAGRNVRQSLKQRGLRRLKNTALNSLSNITSGGRPAGRRPAGRRSLPSGKRRASRSQPRRKKARLF